MSGEHQAECLDVAAALEDLGLAVSRVDNCGLVRTPGLVGHEGLQAGSGRPTFRAGRRHIAVVIS